MERRRESGEYRAIVRRFLASYVDESLSSRRIGVAVSVGTVLIVVGFVLNVLFARSLVQVMSMVTLDLPPDSADESFLWTLAGPFAGGLLACFAAPVVAVIARTRASRRAAWGLLSFLASSVAWETEGWPSVAAAAVAAAVAIPPRARPLLARRVSAVVGLVALAVVGEMVGEGGVAIVAGLAAFAIVAAADIRVAPARIQLAGLAAAAVGVAGVGVVVGANLTSALAVSISRDLPVERSWQVCRGEVTRSCVAEASRRVGIPVAWIRETKRLRAYEVTAYPVRGTAEGEAIESISGPGGATVSVSSGAQPTTGTAVLKRTVDGTAVTLFAVSGGPDGSIEATWQRGGHGYTLSYYAPFFDEPGQDELVEIALRLFGYIEYVESGR